MKNRFTKKLIDWQQHAGRHHLPWQVTDPYCVWLSEIMLQQTQVGTVLNYYPRFIQSFADVSTLANASEDDVLALWSGLGYYSRARNLHKAAKQVISEFNGQFPQNRIALEQLCGVGRSTAAAICAFAFSQQEAILDGNVKRVLCRVFALDGDPMDKKFEQTLWTKAESLLPASKDIKSYTQGLMDLGATICSRGKPKCPDCPMNTLCLAYQQDLTATLPRKKQKKDIPTKTLYWLMLRNKAGELLVTRRPNKGIWGGLYCVPVFETLTDAETYLQNLSLSLTDFEQQTEFTHRLTHFLLLITPFNLTLDNTFVPESGFQWLQPEALQNKAIPTPLLKQLQKTVAPSD